MERKKLLEASLGSQGQMTDGPIARHEMKVNFLVLNKVHALYDYHHADTA